MHHPNTSRLSFVPLCYLSLLGPYMPCSFFIHFSIYVPIFNPDLEISIPYNTFWFDYVFAKSLIPCWVTHEAHRKKGREPLRKEALSFMLAFKES